MTFAGHGPRDDNRGDRMLGLLLLVGLAFAAGVVVGLLGADVLR